MILSLYWLYALLYIIYSSSRIQELEDSKSGLSKERDTCQDDKRKSEEEKSRLRKEIADNKSKNENSKTQINELQNEIVSI